MSELEKLEKCRDAILLAEIGAWLHMLGKYDWRFIESITLKKDEKDKYNYKDFVDELKGYTNLHDILTSEKCKDTLSNLPINIPNNFGVFIKNHRGMGDINKCDHLTSLLIDAHGRGSNIDKSNLKDSYLKNQELDPKDPKIYLSSAFGFSYELKKDHYRTSDLHKKLDELIGEILPKLSKLDKCIWTNFLEDFLSQLKVYFKKVLGDTRIPFNDVTLLDQTASSVSFFKAALAERVVDGKWKKPKDGTKNQYFWRTLTIPLDGLNYLNSVAKLADLLGRKNLLEKTQNNLKNLLEIEYPIGQEIYRDEQVISFLVTDDIKLSEWKNTKEKSLKDLIEQNISNSTEGDLFSNLSKSLLEKGTRLAYKIGNQIDKLSKETCKPDIKEITSQWSKEAEKEICSSCGLRPQNQGKASDRNVCNICLKRRTERVKNWISSSFNKTVWLDEVADINGRLALIVGHWNLSRWLDGTLVSTIVAVSHSDINTKFLDLERNCKTSLSETPYEFSGLLEKLFPNKPIPPQFNNSFKEYFDTIIKPEWEHIQTNRPSDETIAAIHLLRQNPSFSRIRRVWETTKQFWQEVLPTEDDISVEESIIGTKVEKIKERLSISGQLKDSNENTISLGKYHAYDLVLEKEVKLSVVWDSENNRFITCDNFAYLEKILHRQIKEVINVGQTFNIEEPTGYGSKSKICGSIKVESVTSIYNSSYTPVVPILSEPRTFMALVPADKALDIVKEIKLKYEKEMGKVCNRLPLHLGTVFFHSRTPLRAALDAGRQMLDHHSPMSKDLWEVKKISPGLPIGKVTNIQLSQNGSSITWHVPIKMGDGTTDDLWYPYIFIKTEGDDSRINGRKAIKSLRPTEDGKTETCWLVHASDLKERDEIYFTPSTFDFEFLDSSSRRFEIYYNSNGQRPHSNRPFYLNDLDRLDRLWQLIKHLKISQIHKIIHTIEVTREMWFTKDEYQKSQQDEVFKQFVADTLANAEWPKDNLWKNINDCLRKELKNACVKGELTDLAELYLEILKQK